MSKPRIWFDGGLWWCEHDGVRASGLTPQQAFNRLMARLWEHA